MKRYFLCCDLAQRGFASGILEGTGCVVEPQDNKQDGRKLWFYGDRDKWEKALQILQQSSVTLFLEKSDLPN